MKAERGQALIESLVALILWISFLTLSFKFSLKVLEKLKQNQKKIKSDICLYSMTQNCEK